MKRVVYSPKIQAFVKADSGVYDLSPYITDCQVNRKINQVSTASITFRNPNKMFTNGPDGAIFHPMDPILIFLTRLDGRPVQVFTGYCDRTPYLTLKPGLVSISASCTLKRLLYTYWDPGLPFVEKVLSQRGWQLYPASGGLGLQNPSAASQDRTTGQQRSTDGNSNDDTSETGVTDGSIGVLLFDVLQYIGNWHPDTIWIENIPPQVFKRAEGLLGDINASNKEAQKEFKALMKQIIGENSVGGGSGTSNVGSAGGVGPASETVVTPVDVGRAMITVGWTTDQVTIANGIQVVDGESSFGAAGFGDNGIGCYGYWQIRVHDEAGNPVHNVPIEDTFNLVKSTEIAMGIWKGAGNTFDDGSGNPWEAWTGNYQPWMAAAARAIELGPFSESNNATESGNNGPARQR